MQIGREYASISPDSEIGTSYLISKACLFVFQSPDIIISGNISNSETVYFRPSTELRWQRLSGWSKTPWACPEDPYAQAVLTQEKQPSTVSTRRCAARLVSPRSFLICSLKEVAW